MPSKKVQIGEKIRWIEENDPEILAIPVLLDLLIEWLSPMERWVYDMVRRSSGGSVTSVDVVLEFEIEQNRAINILNSLRRYALVNRVVDNRCGGTLRYRWYLA